jgi:glucose/arabinose dehydrogenase
MNPGWRWPGGSLALFGRLLAGVLVLAVLLAQGGCEGAGSTAADSGGADDGGGDGGDDEGDGEDSPPGADDAATAVVLNEAFPALVFEQPVGMFQAPGMESRWFLIELPGRVQAFDDDPAAAGYDLVLDHTAIVDNTGEGGLLGMAFHPDFAQSGAPGENRVYLSYTRADSPNPLESVISEFTYVPGSGTIDAGSGIDILIVDQPFANHNGGHIAFGPDGYLYFGLGDGGSGGDPLGHGQNTSTLLGSLLRIDPVPGGGYDIPAENPFAGGGGAPEIWAWGLRNPWRWSFDRETGALWLGDVGQELWEEVDVIVGGGNYGWNVMEGNHCFNAETCDSSGMIPPAAEYSHGEGCSITGGFVQRRGESDLLYGRYLFADYCEGTVWTLADPYGEDPALSVLMDTDLRPASFAESAAGELFLLDLTGGRIYRFDEE